jgi:hypothetical protein
MSAPVLAVTLWALAFLTFCCAIASASDSSQGLPQHWSHPLWLWNLCVLIVAAVLATAQAVHP